MSLRAKAVMGIALACAKCTGRKFPLIVNWAVTGNCNLRCRHCYGAYGAVQKGELTFSEITKALNELKKAGTRRITIEGGEPLMRRDIDDLMDYIRSLGMEMSLCTNGTLLEKHVPAVKRNADLVVISLDGSRDNHDTLRGHGNFDKVIRALNLCREEKIRTLIFSCLIDTNLGDIGFLIDTASACGSAIAFNIAVARYSGTDERSSLEKPNRELLRGAISEILQHKKNGAPVFYSTDTFNQAAAWPDFEKESYFSSELSGVPAVSAGTLIPCQAGKAYCYIECTGEMYPCYQTVGVFPAKHIVRDGVEEAFRHISSAPHCVRCYNLTLSELNLQCALSLRALARVGMNYFKPA